MESPMLIYDGDCGFCTRSVRFVERLPVSVHLVPWQEVDFTTLRTTQERARHEVLWVATSGAVFGGAPAMAELLRQCRFPWSLLGSVLSVPVLRGLASMTYQAIARNRHRLPGSTPACQLPVDQRPGS